MQPTLLQDILGVLGDERRTFPYFRDRYAFLLLADFVGDGCSVATVRRSHLRQLLQKPSIKEFLSRSGSWLTREAVTGYWPDSEEIYSVTFGRWGDPSEDWDRGWDQTCRRGVNLVVQVNFTGRHDALFRALQAVFGDDDYNSSSHPVSPEQLTLGWARVDFSDDFEEALIEEVQSDWIQRASTDLRNHRELLFDATGRSLVGWGRRKVQLREIVHRYSKEIARHQRIWQEAVLAAAIEVLRTEFSCREIYYHTVDSNRHLKDFEENWGPPRSVYTDLPRRFCFERVPQPPRFIEKTADGFARYKLNRCCPEWHRLSLT